MAMSIECVAFYAIKPANAKLCCKGSYELSFPSSNPFEALLIELYKYINIKVIKGPGVDVFMLFFRFPSRVQPKNLRAK